MFEELSAAGPARFPSAPPGFQRESTRRAQEPEPVDLDAAPSAPVAAMKPEGPKFIPREHQAVALDRIREEFTEGRDRVTVVMPCGTGKTAIAGQLQNDHDRVVVLAPTINLLGQIAEEMAIHDTRRTVLVCSNRPVASEATTEEQEAIASGLNSTDGWKVTTTVGEITNELRRHSRILVIATYASAETVNRAVARAGREYRFDLAVADEAHRTAGLADKAWGLVVREEFATRRRLFMTATPRVIEDPDGVENGSVTSMDTPAYGRHIVPLTFHEAINSGDILSPYHLAVIGVRASSARSLMRRMGSSAQYTQTDAAAHLALARIRERFPYVQSVLTYHNRVENCRRWSDTLQEVFNMLSVSEPHLRDVPLSTFYMHANTPHDEREEILRLLKEPGEGAERELVVASNCHVLAEGINVPGLDAVMFAEPRGSTPDIIQIVGRALRNHPRKTREQRLRERALVIVPVLVEDENDDVDSAAARSSHHAAWRIMQSMAMEDVFIEQALIDWGISASTGIPEYSENERLSIDFPEGADISAEAANFFIRVIAGSTPPLQLTLGWVRKWHAAHGDEPYPRAEWVPSGDELVKWRAICGSDPYPSGTWIPDFYEKSIETGEPVGFKLAENVKRVRNVYHAKKLDRALVKEFEKIPEWRWEHDDIPRQPRVGRMVTCIERGVERGNIEDGYLHRNLPAYIVDGLRRDVAHWFYVTKREGELLNEEERKRLIQVIPRNFDA